MKEKKTLDMAARNSISRIVPGGWTDPVFVELSLYTLYSSSPWSIPVKMAKSDRSSTKALVFLGTRL
jgi:hypothetical protein